MEVDPPFHGITQHPSFQRVCNTIVGFSQVRVMRAPQETNNMYVNKYIYLPMLFGRGPLSLMLNVDINFRQLAIFTFVSNPHLVANRIPLCFYQTEHLFFGVIIFTYVSNERCVLMQRVCKMADVQ